MVESSKILTVSYGTFSCTLEGFEDSFGTMKAIAEYFRDLAAGDRYFGAEPPTPDAEMLARIAENEIARRVEARTDDSGIVLRAAPALAAAAQPAPAPEVAEEQEDDAQVMPPQIAPSAEAEAALEDAKRHEPEEEEIAEVADEAPVAAVASLDDIADVDVEEPADEDDAFAEMAVDVAQPPAHPDPESVAAKLQRIRAVVGQPAIAEDDEYGEDLTAASIVENAEAEDASTDEIHDQVMAAPDAEEDVAQEAVAEMDSIMAFDAPIEPAEDTDADVEDTPTTFEFDDTDYDFDAADDDVTTADYDAAPDVEDEADVVADQSELAETDDADEVDDTDQQITDVLRNLERAGAAAPDAETDEVAEVEADPIPDMVAEDVMPDVVADAEPVDEQIDASANVASTLEAFGDLPEEAEEPEEPARPSLRARILRVAKQSTGLAATKANEPEVSDVEAEASDDDAYAAIAADAGADADMADDESQIADDIDDADDGYSVAALDGADDLTDFDDVAPADLSPEDEAELQAELQDVEREAAEDRARGKSGRDILPETDDAAMSRIMSQADEELSRPETSRRRDAIAQLKAAVAATEAARQLGDNGEDESAAQDAFREDLEHVVRPRRAERARASDRTERPRPAPLKLVASQRIDTDAAPADAAEPAAPVAPRRVATAEPVVQTDASSFAEFASEMGATELPDLLEAAAAYTAFVEGIEDFSRPQIMKKVQATTETTFSREDGLRSFGTLLRQGRISKIRNGRFQISEQTRFKPEQRAS